MLSKSDVGTCTYAPPGAPLPHAVASISGSTISTTFTYDPDGNQTSGLGRTITWTSYNAPATITQGTASVSFLHDVDHQRYKQVSTAGTTLYIAGFGVLAELAGPGTGTARWTDYLAVGNAKVGMRVTDVTTQAVSTRYFHTDHLGSIAVITDEAGAVVERLSYDAWGKRRFPNGADDAAGSIESQTTRGFTGEEHLDQVALVHLNGRVYDPLVGRMISADPTVPDPMNAQAWNRYSYVGNDPLAFTDPSGFSWLSSFFHSVVNAISAVFRAIPILRSIVQIVISAAITIASGGTLTLAGAVIAAATGSAVVTGLSGGRLGDVLRAAALSAATAAAFYGVGSATNAVAGYDPSAPHITPEFGTPEYAFNVAGHAAAGCISSAASGGSCGSGALAGAAGASVAPAVVRAGFVGGTAISGVVGGLASVAGGGKFENGAVTSAFGYMFNAAAPKWMQPCDSVCQGGRNFELQANGAIEPSDDVFALAGGVGGIIRAIAARIGAEIAVSEGTILYRVWGDEAAAWGRSWTTVDPRNISATYRDLAGLPNANSGRFLSEGVLQDSAGVSTRSAFPLNGNAGGLPEVVVPNPQSQIWLRNVQGLNPKF